MEETEGHELGAIPKGVSIVKQRPRYRVRKLLPSGGRWFIPVDGCT